MDNLNGLVALAENNLGAFAVLAILLLIRYQDRREVRQSEASQRDVLRGFVQNFARTVEEFAGTLADQSAALRAISGSVERHQTALDGTRGDLHVLLSEQKQLQEGIDQLPGRVSERLVEDFEQRSVPEKRVQS
jgi:hypothetical protein